MAILAGVLAPPLIGTFVQQPAALSTPRPDSGGIEYAVLMEVKGVNGLGVNGYQILNSSTLLIQGVMTYDPLRISFVF